jgi:cytochrome c peroxidase
MKGRPAPTSLTILTLVLLFLASDGPARQGRERDELAARANRVFGRLPLVMASEKNPVTPERVRLGKILFYETRISVDGTVSCSRCHPISLYGADGLKRSIGNRSKVNPRNAPTILNAAAQISAHWIGNRADVEDQAKQSVVGPASFGMPSPAEVEKKLKEIPGYGPLFKGAFPQDMDPVTVNNLARAVGVFERTLVTPSPFDAFLAGNKHALTEREKKGIKIFMDAGCATCHSGVYVGGHMYQKFGLIEPYGKYTRSEVNDEGRYAVTKNESDRNVFKVPVLRNVARTARLRGRPGDGRMDHGQGAAGEGSL